VLADLDRYDVTSAADRIWTVVRALNRYVTERKPWEIAKDEARGAELDQVLYDLADGLRAVAVALAAYLPETAPQILDALGQPRELGWDEVAYGRLRPAEGIAASAPLFPRIDADAAAAS
jgi:methionyl-tRNA synthetase